MQIKVFHILLLKPTLKGVPLEKKIEIDTDKDEYNCDDPAGRHLGQGGPTNPPQKEQCKKDSVYCPDALG